MALGQKRFADINGPLSEKLTEKKHLIAVHRGSWGGNIIQNTIAAYTCAFKMGADLVESDVNSTVDGVLYSFHDGHEPDLLGVNKCIKQMTSAEVEENHPFNTTRQRNRRPIDCLSDIVDWLPKGKFLNIDRAWDIFPQLLAELDRHPKALRQVIVKAPVRGTFHGVPVEEALKTLAAHPVKYMFMPICYSLQDVETALTFTDINTVGCEIIAFKETDELYSDEAINGIRARNLYTWVNAIELGNWNRDMLFGSLDDDISLLEDPALGWGKLFEKHVDILQTDWPAILYGYRREALGIE